MSTRDFSFPLNVFARLLEHVEGAVEYLHFAVFDQANDSINSALERASAVLFEALPPPCRLLEVGIGVGTTLARLRAAGYNALGITPEQAQIEVARARHGADLPVERARLEDFSTGAGTWEAILLQESSQYIEPIDLFDSAERLLKPGANSLIVMDEFALRRDDASHYGLRHLEHFCALAARFGWRCTQRIDLSNAVRPTLDYLIANIDAHRTWLMSDLGLPSPVMNDLLGALERSRGLYGEGVMGYALLRLDRSSPPANRLVRIGARNSEAMRALFAAEFGRPMTAAEWQWKYGDGRGRGLGLQRGSELVAHYAGLTREVLFGGERVRACQVCDVVVSTRARESLQRAGPLYQLTASFLESEIGWSLPHRIGYGFPTRRAYRTAERLGLYAAVDSMACVRWPADAGGLSAGREMVIVERADLEPGRAAADAVEALWDEMSASLPGLTIGLRDAQWLLHRYFDHPLFRYHLVFVQPVGSSRPEGLLVARLHDRHLEWVDAVSPASRFGELLGATCELARSHGLDAVEAWITTSQRHLLESLRPGVGEWRDLGITIPTNAHSPGPELSRLCNRWLLMAGDTDFR